MTSSQGPPNPFEVIGVPKWAVVRGLATGDLSKVLKAAERIYRDLSVLYHSDVTGETDDVMSAMATAIAELRNPAGLRVHAAWYVDPASVSAAERAATVRHMRERESAQQHRLAQALVNVNPLRVLGVEGPVRFIAALDSLGGPFSEVYQQAVAGELTAATTHIQVSEIVLRAWDEAIDFSGQPKFHRPSGQWTDLRMAVAVPSLAADEPVVVPTAKRTRIGPLKAVAGDVRLVGGVSTAYLRQIASTLRDEPKIQTGTDALELLADNVQPRSIVWAQLTAAWWMPGFRPTVGPGDYLALMSNAESEPNFAIVGPLLKVEPM